MRCSFLIASLLAAMVPAQESVAAASIGEQLSNRLSALSAEQIVSIIVFFDDGQKELSVKTGNREQVRVALNKSLRNRARDSQSVVVDLLKTKNIHRHTSIWSVNGLAVKVPARLVKTVAEAPQVSRIVLDRIVEQPKTIPVAAEAAASWNIDMTEAPQLWQQGYRGAGITVAIMDTGVDYLHQDLAGNWRGGANSWYDPHNQHLLPYDHDGHGTQTAGVIVGNSSIGMAPQANWIGVKIFNDSGNAALSDIHLGFQWLLDPDDNPITQDMPHIVNCSWGFAELVNQCFAEFQPSIQLLKASNIAVVFAAGNTGPGFSTTISPANNSGSFTVGGVYSDGTVTDFSGRGPSPCNASVYPQIVAPAADVRTTDLTFNGFDPAASITVSGTSVAAPHVAGAMALLLDAYPWLSVTGLEEALQQSAGDIGTVGPDNESGYGLVKVLRAFEYVQANSCMGADGLYLNPNCDEPPVTPPKGEGGSVPILQLLLSDTQVGRRMTGDHKTSLVWNNPNHIINHTYEGYYEVTQ